MSRRAVTEWGRHRIATAKPATPAAPTVTRVTDTEIDLSWDVADPAATYVLERSTDLLTWTTRYSSTGVTWADTGLTGDTTYNYRLTVIVSAVSSDPSSTVSQRTLLIIGPPNAPATPTASLVTSSGMRVSWVAPPTGPPATSYDLQRSTSPTTGFATIHSGPEMFYDDTGLTAVTTYYYQVRASNSSGPSGYSTPLLQQATTAAPVTPTTPTGLALSTVGTTTLTASWNASAGAVSYQVRRSTAAAPTTWTQVYDGSGTTFDDSGLTAATTYNYQVRATNPLATTPSSAYSASVSTTTDPLTGGNAQPVSAKVALGYCGMVVHQNFAGGVYSRLSEVEARLSALGVKVIRTNFSDAVNNPTGWIAMCRNLGIKLQVTCQKADSSLTDNQVRNGIDWLQQNAANVMIGWEGVNEPSHYTGGTKDHWMDAVIHNQQLIYDYVRSFSNLDNSFVISSAMHMKESITAYNAGDNWWADLADRGILAWMDIAALHSYPYDDQPDADIDTRIGILNAAWPGKPVWVTETGYSDLWPNGTNSTYQTTYGARWPLEYVQRRTPYRMYELLDDSPVDQTGVQRVFGQVSVPGTSDTAAMNTANWAWKDRATAFMSVTGEWVDPDGTAAYTPGRVQCDISTTATNVKSVLTATKAQSDAGQAMLFLYRHQAANVTTTAPVTVTDSVGTRTPNVGPAVTKLKIGFR